MPLKKIIRVPVKPVGVDANVTKYLKHFIDTPEFQRLRGVKQLDLVEKVYPGATHTRFEHSLGVLLTMRDIIRKNEEENDEKEAPIYKFSKREKTTLELVALLHDFGHLSFSHGLEPMLIALGEPSHDEKVLEYLEKFRPKIEKIPGADFELVVETFKRKTPYYPMIWSLIGADVLDYVIRDADRCAVAGGSDVERLKTYTFFDGKHYGLETKAILSLDQHINFWISMYMEVYNRKGCALWKGIIRTGVYEAIKMGKIKPQEIWNMTDGELLARLVSCGGLPRKISRKRMDFIV